MHTRFATWKEVVGLSEACSPRPPHNHISGEHSRATSDADQPDNALAGHIWPEKQRIRPGRGPPKPLGTY
jgi:hypothetical protein